MCNTNTKCVYILNKNIDVILFTMYLKILNKIIINKILKNE